MNGVENASHAQGRDVTSEHRLGPTGLHETLGCKVVDLTRTMFAQDVDERCGVEKITWFERDPVLDMGNAFEVDGRRPPHHSNHLVTLLQQMLGEVRTVLTGDAGDERSFGTHGVHHD